MATVAVPRVRSILHMPCTTPSTTIVARIWPFLVNTTRRCSSLMMRVRSA
jgi:hypothetical protein